ncbi:MAG TPA: hypothetical protein VGC93_10855 [Thermoanaerobaculia bacterium]
MAMALLAASAPLGAQAFDSGSTGADGALTLTTPGTVVFDPASFSPPLDPDGDNVYHFTSITIGSGVTVRLLGPRLTMSPVFWLATGPVQIDGTVDLSGSIGQHGTQVLNDGSRVPSVPGAGGFPGGVGGTATSPPSEGNGPGGGRLPDRGDHPGGGASHAFPGGSYLPPRPAYGNQFLLPLLGGSGGGGTYARAGGGAGGGALLLASSVSIVVNGSILADGGNGGWETGTAGQLGGGGSGGALHLLAPTLSGTGTLTARGGNPGVFTAASAGRIRLEAFQQNFAGNISGASPVRATVFTRDLTRPLSTVRVVSVDGQPVPTNPDGSFTVPDVTISKGTAATVAIEGRNVPPGTVAEIRVYSEAATDQVVNSTPLAGTLALSSATASVVFPPGFSRAYVRATWTP